MSRPVTTWRYHLPSIKGEGWAIVFLDSQGSFAALSDWGNVGYRWPDESEERDFRASVVHMGDVYLTSKLGQGRQEYDPEATLLEVKRTIIERRRGDASDKAKDRARSEWRLLEEHDDLAHEVDFARWYEHTTFDDAGEFHCQRHVGEVTGFIEHAMPRLREVLRAELEAEQSKAGAA